MENDMRRLMRLVEGLGDAGRIEAPQKTVRVWYQPRTRKIIPVSTQEDHGATVFEYPRRFGLPDDMAERVKERHGSDHVIDVLTVLAMKRGWVRINDEPDGYDVPLVMAASGRLAHQGAEWLAGKIALPALQIDIIDRPDGVPVTSRLKGKSLKDFLDTGVL